MRLDAVGTLAATLVLVLGQGLAPGVARAGVPRACIHPNYNPIECREVTRLEHLDVLPSARVRSLRRQRPELERTVPWQERERNALLEQIRDALGSASPASR